MSKPTNVLTQRLEEYIQQQERINDICSLNRVLQILSESVTDLLPNNETAKVELRFLEEYTTVIITIPGDSDIAKQGPYTYRIRTAQ